jgi:hypothetical protein
MASLPVIAGQEMDEGLEEMWLGSAQGIQVIDAGEFTSHFRCISLFVSLLSPLLELLEDENSKKHVHPQKTFDDYILSKFVFLLFCFIVVLDDHPQCFSWFIDRIL